MLHPGSSVPALLLGPSHFSEGRTPGPPFPSLHAPGTQIHRGLVSPPAVRAPSVYYLESDFNPHRGEGRGNWGWGWGGGGSKPGSDPRPLPPLEPRASALLGQGRLCEIPEGPRRRGLGAAGEGWGLTASPSVCPSVRAPGHRPQSRVYPFFEGL